MNPSFLVSHTRVGTIQAARRPPGGRPVNARSSRLRGNPPPDIGGLTVVARPSAEEEFIVSPKAAVT